MSDFYHEEFADELAHIISPPDYDCFCFKNEPNSGDFTMDVVEDTFPTREPRVHVHNVLSTYPTLQLNLDFILSSESLFAYVVWIFLPFLSYSVAPQYLLSFGNEDTILIPASLFVILYAGCTGYSQKDKNQSQNDKTKHGMEEREKAKPRWENDPEKLDAAPDSLRGESPHNPSSLNPKRHNRRRSKQPFILEESPVDTMADQRTLAELLCTPTEGYAEAIVVPPILAEQFELKHNLINMMTSDQFFGLEKDNPHDHIRAARRWLEKEPPRSILTWEDLVSKFINELFSSARTSNLHNEISNFQQRFDESFHEAWDQYRDLLPPVKAVEEIYITCGGAHPYYQCLATGGNTFPKLRDNIQGYVLAAAVNYNQGNPGYRPQGSGSLPSNTVANPKGELKAITTRSGLVTDGPTVPTLSQSINPEGDERVEEMLTINTSTNPSRIQTPHKHNRIPKKAHEMNDTNKKQGW
nr:reverse transcriptase domain-containing protein [Tanacetum cinerariifolium]